ncbi:MAG: hypothetical protein H0U75_11155 [Legionella sp.]|nr:hypothetical protein [Legionella sp.]
MIYNPFAKRNLFFYKEMGMSAYFLWFFRCLTGWGVNDKINHMWAFSHFPFCIGLLGQYNSEIEDYHVGFLDYLFLVPAISKFLLKGFSGFSGFSETFDEIESFVSFSNVLFFFVSGSLKALNLLCLPFVYLTALITMVLLSPFLFIYRTYETNLWNKQKADILELDVFLYPPSTALLKIDQSYLIQKYETNELKKTKLSEFQENLHYFELRIISSKDLLVFDSPGFQGIVVPHRGTSKVLEPANRISCAHAILRMNPRYSANRI